MVDACRWATLRRWWDRAPRSADSNHGPVLDAMVLNVLGRLRELPYCDYLSLAGESDGSGGEAGTLWALAVAQLAVGRPRVTRPN